MSVNLVIAVADGEWYGLLRQRPHLGKVNFRSPLPRMFRALRSGEPFLFELHSPRDLIVGGGVFAHASTLAWEAFGEGNGARSALEMRAHVARYRRVPPGDRSDFVIGCRVLTDPFFLDERDWIEVPPNRSRDIVQSETHGTGEPEGTALRDALQRRLARPAGVGADEVRARYGPPRVVRPGWARAPSGCWSPTSTSGAAPSRRNAPCPRWRRRTSGRTPKAGRTKGEVLELL